MGASGAIIMGFFGAIFAAVTLALPLDVRGVILATPFAVFAAILVAALAIIRRPGPRLALSPAAERVVMWSTIAEGIGIPVAIELVVNFGHAAWELPAIALIVGLHFLPIARATALGAFYLLGGALVAAAIVGAALAPPIGPIIAGAAAATALWLAAIAAVRREARFKQLS